MKTNSWDGSESRPCRDVIGRRALPHDPPLSVDSAKEFFSSRSVASNAERISFVILRLRRFFLKLHDFMSANRSGSCM